MFLVDTVRGRVIEDEEIGDPTPPAPVPRVGHGHRDGLDELPRADQHRAARSRDAAPETGRVRLHAGRAVHGAHAHGRERLGDPWARWAPTRRSPCCRTGAAALRLFQAAVRAGDQPADRPDPRAARHVALGQHRSAHNVLGERPEHARRIRVRGPILHERTAREDPVGGRARGRSALPLHHAARALPPRWRGARLHLALESLCRRASRGRHEGNTSVISDRGVDADWAPIPSLLATAGRAPSPRARGPRAPRSASSSRRARRAT